MQEQIGGTNGHSKGTRIYTKLVLVHTDGKITLQLLQNEKKHTKLIEQIRTKVQEMEHACGG